MSRRPLEPIDLSRARAHPLSERENKCRLEDFREPAAEDASFAEEWLIKQQKPLM